MRQATSSAWVVILCLICAVGVQAQQSGAASDLTSTAATTASSVPRLVRFNGTLQDATGKALTGPVDVTFELFREQSGGEPLWWETQTVEVDAQGRYSVLLGAMQPSGLPMDLFTAGEAHWLGVAVGKIEQPRVLLVSVPYAFKAGDAETLGGQAGDGVCGLGSAQRPSAKRGQRAVGEPDGGAAQRGGDGDESRFHAVRPHQ